MLGNRTQGLHDDVRKMDPLYRLFELACDCLMHISCFDFRQKEESVFGQKSNLNLIWRKAFSVTLILNALIAFQSGNWAKSIFSLGRSPGLVAMAGGSCAKGHGFENSTEYWVDILSHLFVVRIVMFVWKGENKRKRGRGWPICSSTVDKSIDAIRRKDCFHF